MLQNKKNLFALIQYKVSKINIDWFKILITKKSLYDSNKKESIEPFCFCISITKLSKAKIQN